MMVFVRIRSRNIVLFCYAWKGDDHSLFDFCIQVVYVIVKIVTLCFNRPSLILSRPLVG